MARSKGEGTLIKRGKYWTARWVSNGEVHVRSTKCTSKRKAPAVKKVRRQVKRGKKVAKVEKSADAGTSDKK